MAHNLASFSLALSRCSEIEDAQASHPLSQGGAAMKDHRFSVFVIEMNIAHYKAMLKPDMGGAKRSVIERLLDETKLELVRARKTAKIDSLGNVDAPVRRFT
jgi:hypothetical protein